MDHNGTVKQLSKPHSTPKHKLMIRQLFATQLPRLMSAGVLHKSTKIHIYILVKIPMCMNTTRNILQEPQGFQLWHGQFVTRVGHNLPTETVVNSST